MSHYVCQIAFLKSEVIESHDVLFKYELTFQVNNISKQALDEMIAVLLAGYDKIMLQRLSITPRFKQTSIGVECLGFNEATGVKRIVINTWPQIIDAYLSEGSTTRFTLDERIFLDTGLLSDSLDAI